MFRIARISDPRVVVDTGGLPPEYTAFANRLAAEIGGLPPETIRRLAGILEKACNSRPKSP